MSVLLNEIKCYSPEAASTLKRAGLHSDSEILSLTQEDLRDLFPGVEKFQLRRRVYEIIHRQKPIDVVQKEMQQLIQHESLRGSLPSTSATSNPGECHKNQTDDHPPEAKGTKDFMIWPLSLWTGGHPQKSQNADMSVLRNEIKRFSSQAARRLEDTKAFIESLFSLPTGGRPQKSQSTVTYEVVVYGKTFDAHLELMNSVKSPVQDWLQFLESSEDSRVVVVFCPISSRVGSDVEAAMREVKVEKPVILVLMHHRRDAGSSNFGRTWDTPNVVLCVSVFFHETINGLVKCDENNVAVDQIRMKLMEYKTEVKIPMQMDGSSSRSWR